MHVYMHALNLCEDFMGSLRWGPSGGPLHEEGRLSPWDPDKPFFWWILSFGVDVRPNRSFYFLCDLININLIVWFYTK